MYIGRQCMMLLLMVGLTAAAAVPAFGAAVAVIGPPAETTAWCDLLVTGGYTCTTFPDTGPTMSLDSFDVVVDAAAGWSDPDGALLSVLQAGKGVITWGEAPISLGLLSDPLVRSWVGANGFGDGQGPLTTVVMDPILGMRPPGTQIGDCPFDLCPALADTTGHPDAIILAWHNDFNQAGIGILRNSFQSGQSIYLEQIIVPAGSQFDNLGNAKTNDEIILNAVNTLAPGNAIPTVSAWGLVVMVLLMLTSATVLL